MWAEQIFRNALEIVQFLATMNPHIQESQQAQNRINITQITQ